MKNIYSVIIIFLLSYVHVDAQIKGYTLDEDPIFTATIAHRIHYPVKAIKGSVYGRFYVKFFIDSIGSIQDITILYPHISPKYAKRLGFEYEITNGLKKLPQLSPRYKGSYILPISFVYINYSEDSNPRLPTNTLPLEKYLDNSLTLNEIKILGNSNMYNSLRPVSGRAPASRQIVDF